MEVVTFQFLHCSYLLDYLTEILGNLTIHCTSVGALAFVSLKSSLKFSEKYMFSINSKPFKL